MTISAIVAGAGLILHGGAMAVRASDLMEETSEGRGEQTAVGTGITVEALGGIAGVTLGILALIGVAPIILTAVSVIVFGACLLLSSGAVSEMNDLRLARAGVDESTRRMSRRATVGAAGIQALLGIGTLALGILAVIEIVPIILSLVGLLCTGAALLLSGGALTARMATFLGSR